MKLSNPFASNPNFNLDYIHIWHVHILIEPHGVADHSFLRKMWMAPTV